MQEARVARRGLIVWGNCMLDRVELMRTIAWLGISFARQSSGEHSGISTEKSCWYAVQERHVIIRAAGSYTGAQIKRPAGQIFCAAGAL